MPKNRDQRRKDKKAKKAGKGGLGGVVTLHYKPGNFDPNYTALLLSQLSHAYELGSELPKVAWPIHIVVQFDGKKVCGTIEPGDDAVFISPPDGPIVH